MTLLRLALRYQRTGVVATTILTMALGVLNAVGYAQIAGTDPGARTAFAQQMELLGRQLSYVLPAPAQLDTLAGYMVWRAFGAMTVMYAFWALLAATGAARGDEERGIVEQWLAIGVSRGGWLGARTIGYAIASAVSVAAAFGATAVGAMIANEPLPLGALALQGVALWALTLSCFGIGLVVAQLVTTRRAASAAGALFVLALFLVNSAGRTGVAVGEARWLSPFYLYERSEPLLAGGSVDVVATLALIGIGATLAAAAAAAFARRDVGGPLIRREVANGGARLRPSSDPLLRRPVLALVAQQRAWIGTWAAGLVVLAAFLTSMTRTLVDGLNRSDIPAMRAYFQRAGISAYSDFVGVIWFSTLLLLVSLYVAAQVSSWAADDGEGRLEVVLSAPVSRTRVVLERIGALAIATAFIVAVSSLAVYLAARANEITLPSDRLAVASVDVIPVAFAFAGVGHALVAWRPRLAVALIGAVAATSYFTQQFAPLFDWPEWVRRTSLYTLYGTPLTKDDWSGIAALLAIGLVGTAVALVAMRRRDVGR